MPSTASTHDLVIGPSMVTKQFRINSRHGPEREWTALTLLDEHAHGLAPAPLALDLAGAPPTVTMTKLPGVPLDRDALSPAQATAVAAALEAMLRAVPAAALADLPRPSGAASASACGGAGACSPPKSHRSVHVASRAEGQCRPRTRRRPC